MDDNSACDKRDWGRDNEAEGRFEEVLDEFPDEKVISDLKTINDDKVGAPFRVPDCAIEWAAKQIAAHGIGYRAAARKITKEMNRLGFPGIKYAQLYKRIRRLRIH